MQPLSLLRSIGLALAVFAFSAAAEDSATNGLNRFSFSGRVGLNLTASFKSAGALTLSANTRTTPTGDRYNYDDGYVRTDSSGNAGGQTWYWGYDNPSQISGNTILMSRSSLSGGSALAPDSTATGTGLGGELTYNRQLLARGEMRYGLEAAASYLNVHLQDSSPFQTAINRTTDAYPFTPGTTPPLAPPVYQGTFGGPGFLLGSTPVSSTAVALPGGGTVVGNRKFDADLWGLRLGPGVSFPVFEVLQLSLSGGLALGWVNSSVSWNETVSVAGGTASASGSGHDSNLLFGGYLGGQLSYQISERWSATAGVQYQNLGTYRHAIGGRVVELDLSKMIFVSLGVGYSF